MPYSKPEKDTIICPRCNLPFGFVRCRVSSWKDGVRVERCLKCGVEDENVARVTTGDNILKENK